MIHILENLSCLSDEWFLSMQRSMMRNENAKSIYTVTSSFTFEMKRSTIQRS